MKLLRLRVIVPVALCAALLAVLIGTASATTIHGTGTDPHATWLGPIKYVFNPAGYQFWFTPTGKRQHLYRR